MAESKKAVATTKKALYVPDDEIKIVDSMVVKEGEEEHLTQEEVELPFLRVAQKGSPQIDEDKPEYIKGLKPGMYFNTATGAIYGNEIVVQVHGYFPNFVIWKGAKGAGKFCGSMTREKFREFERNNELARNGGDMVQIVDNEEFRYTDTRNFIVTLPEHMEDGVMIYSLSSTGIKPAKKWNTLNNARKLNGEQAKRYMTIWQLKTDGFEGDGFTWKQLSSIKPLGWATDELEALGRSFEDFVKSIREQGIRYAESDSATESSDDSDY